MQRNSEETGMGRWENRCMVTNSVRCRQLLGLGNNQGTGELESHYWAWPGLEEVLPGTDEEEGQSARACLAGSSGSFQRCKPFFDRNCPQTNKQKRNNFSPSSQWLPVPSKLRSLSTVQGTQKFCLRKTGGLWLELFPMTSWGTLPLWEINLKQTVRRHCASLTRLWRPLALLPKVTAMYLGRVNILSFVFLLFGRAAWHEGS